MPQLPLPLATFTSELSALLSHPHEAPSPCPQIAQRLEKLVADDAWLAPEWRATSTEGYRRQCLYQDPSGLFSIGCFVWAANQQTPIHDHHSWGVIGVLSGAITSETFTQTASGLNKSEPVTLQTGRVAWVHPHDGDIHRIGGAAHGGISIHVYGCAFDTVCKNLYPA